MSTSSVPRPAIARRSRFRRAAASPIRLTEDDLTILGHVARHRFLRSTHLVQVMPHRSGKKLLERLAELYHNGLLDRPRAQLDYFATAGSAPLVYALGNKGALMLGEQTGMDRAQIDWTWKNRSVGRLFIDHTLMIADVMVGMERACARHAGIELMDAQAILASVPEATRRLVNPFKLTAPITANGRSVESSVIPDAVFGLDFTHERKRKYFFLEADNATMPVMRANLNLTSYARKLMTYYAGGGKANAFGAQLGIGNFRVLTVTTSRDRVATMIDALKQLTGGIGSAQFLFVDHARLLAADDLLALEWTSGKGDPVRLTD